MGRRVLGWVCVSLVACGDNIVPVYGVSDGSRLAARFWDAGDGARVLRTWFDHELGIECHFDLATDGRFRCLPFDASPDVAFADAACTRPLTVVPACAPVPAFVFGPRRATPGCGRSRTRAVHAVGRMYGGAVFSQASGGDCAPGVVPKGYRAYEVGAERAPTAFVGATLEAQGDARLVPYVFVADDGSRFFDGIWDTQRNAECNGSDSQGSCRPAEIALGYDFMFSDAACSKNDAAVDLSDFRPCHPPTAVLAGGDASGLTYLEIGAQIPAGAAYRRDSVAGTCAPELPYDDETYWFEGPPIASESFAPMSRVRDGDGRVRAERWVDDGGRSLSTSTRFVDTQLDEPCAPTVFADGVRCAASSAVQYSHTFMDAGCKTPVLAWPGDKPRVAYTPHVATDECDTIQYDAAHELGGVVTQATYFVQQDASCTSLQVPMGTKLYKLGAEVDVPRIDR